MSIIGVIILAVFLFAMLGCGVYESIQAQKLYIRRIRALEKKLLMN